MQPDVGDVHVNALLSTLSIALMNDDAGFIASGMFPDVYLEKQSDVYPVYGSGTFFQDPGHDAMVRAPGAPTPLAGYTMSTSPYYAENFAIGAEIPDELRANRDAVYDLDNNALQLVTGIQKIRRERAFSADFMTTGVWGTDATGGSTFTKWSDYGGSDPIRDFRTGIRTVQTATGRRPNKLGMGRIVWDKLQDHPDLVGRLNGGATPGQPAIVKREFLAQLLEIDEVLVGDAVYDATAEGGTPSLTRIVDDDALLLYTPRSPGLMTPAGGYTFVWRTAQNGTQAPWFIRKWRDDRQRRDVIEAHAYWDQVKTLAAAGYFFSDAVD